MSIEVCKTRITLGALQLRRVVRVAYPRKQERCSLSPQFFYFSSLALLGALLFVDGKFRVLRESDNVSFSSSEREKGRCCIMTFLLMLKGRRRQRRERRVHTRRALSLCTYVQEKLVDR